MLKDVFMNLYAGGLISWQSDMSVDRKIIYMIILHFNRFTNSKSSEHQNFILFMHFDANELTIAIFARYLMLQIFFFFFCTKKIKYVTCSSQGSHTFQIGSCNWVADVISITLH